MRRSEWEWHDAVMEPLPAVIWSEEARHELPARPGNRRLVLDYFATRCCGRNVSVGDLHLRWTAASEPIAEEYLPLRAPVGLEAYVQEDLVPVFEATRGWVVMRGWPLKESGRDRFLWNRKRTPNIATSAATMPTATRASFDGPVATGVAGGGGIDGATDMPGRKNAVVETPAGVVEAPSGVRVNDE